MFSHSWINKLISEENKVPEECLKLERWQGPPNKNKVKQYEIVLSFKVGLFILFIQSWKQSEFVYLVCLRMKKKKNPSTRIFLFFPKTTQCTFKQFLLSNISACAAQHFA